MKIWKPVIFLFLSLGIASQALCQSIQPINLAEGDYVDLDGFVIPIKLDGLTAYDLDRGFDVSIQVREGYAFVATAWFDYGGMYSGKNIKLMEPDVYFPNLGAWADTMRIVAKIGSMEPYGVVSGDDIEITLKVDGYVEGDPYSYYHTIVVIAEE